MKRQVKTGPDFIGIGAHKAGTNWLYQQLRALPDYDLLPRKEIHYFDRNPCYSTSTRLNQPLGERLRNPSHLKHAQKDLLRALVHGSWTTARFYRRWHFGRYTDGWYRSLFTNPRGYTGELCPGYALLSVEDIRWMYRVAPQTKILFLLRNPIDRAWSQARYRRVTKVATGEFDEVEVKQFFRSPLQTERSDYLETMRRFALVYPAEQLRVAFYDAIIEQPYALLKATTDFLGPVPEDDLQRCPVSKVVKPSSALACPPSLRAYLQEMYMDDLHQLAELLGGYAQRWYSEAIGMEATAGEALPSPLQPFPKQ